MQLKTIKDLGDIRGKFALVRADLNVPAKDGAITDESRITRFAPTARLLADKGAKVVVITHYGRPKGVTPEFSTAFLAPALAKAVGKPVAFAADSVGEVADSAKAAMKDGDIMLLENVRFYPEEEENSAEFSKRLAEGYDFFVNDAFSAAHRAHASTEGITHFLPSYAGLLMEEEIDALTAALENPARPSVAIVAGSKVSTKISVLENLAAKVDSLIIGGAMANTFLLAQGFNIGASLAERDMVDVAARILASAPGKILLPADAVVALDLAEGVPVRTCSLDEIAPDEKILDIGPLSVSAFEARIALAKTVLMNGPVGAFEIKPFDEGTNALAKFIASRTLEGSLVSVAGGGDTVSALEHAGVASDFTYISTAGGAFLEWLEGKTLPALPPLAA